jgi:hypothetical protein
VTPGLGGIGFRICFRLLVREQEKLKGDEKNNQTARVSLPNSARYEHRSSSLELTPKLVNPNHLLLTAGALWQVRFAGFADSVNAIAKNDDRVVR